MLESLTRWMKLPRRIGGGHGGIAQWAQQQEYEFRTVRGEEGFVVDGRVGAQSWRLEWGAPQRDYIKGSELRIRLEAALPGEWQALILTRPLQEQMEREVFDQYVEDVQTRVDTQTPPEMRWLVMYPKAASPEWKALRERWTGVSNLQPWMTRWVEGPLARELENFALDAGRPVVLMLARGRLTLRTSLARPDANELQRHLNLFETAARQARGVATELGEGAAPSTQPSLWSPSEMADAAHVSL